MNLVIVGAGPSGIGLGILLKKLNFHDFIIFENIHTDTEQSPKTRYLTRF